MVTTPPLKCALRTSDIVDAFLLATGEALRLGNFDLFHPHFSLPYRAETFEGVVEVDEKDELRRLFDAACAYYTQTGIARLLRTCLSVHMRDEQNLVATYETLLMPHIGSPTRAAYWCNMDMRLEDGGWKTHRRAFAIADDAAHAWALLGHAHPPNTQAD